MRLLLAALLFCCAANSALAAAKPVPTERVIAVLPDGSLQLQTSGKAVLENILLPDAKLAESWLAAHALQQEIDVDADDKDRYGRVQFTSSIEEKMLHDGVALLYVSNGEVPDSWHAAEAAARKAGSGVWANKNLLLSPDALAQHESEFHVVEGTIKHIYEGKTATYLNFGADWHTDFSVTIPAKNRRRMQEVLDTLHEGSTVRVRGMVYEENGPMMKLTNAENLELN